MFVNNNNQIRIQNSLFPSCILLLLSCILDQSLVTISCIFMVLTWNMNDSAGFRFGQYFAAAVWKLFFTSGLTVITPEASGTDINMSSLSTFHMRQGNMFSISTDKSDKESCLVCQHIGKETCPWTSWKIKGSKCRSTCHIWQGNNSVCQHVKSVNKSFPVCHEAKSGKDTYPIW